MASSEHPYTLVEDEGDASETPRSAWPAQDDGRHQSFVGLRGAVAGDASTTDFVELNDMSSKGSSTDPTVGEGGPEELLLGSKEMDDGVGEEPGVEEPPHSLLSLVLLNSGWVGLTALVLAWNVVLLPSQARATVGDDKAGRALSLMVAIAAVVVVLLTPYMGMLSDRVAFGIGRRRSYMIIGTVIVCAFQIGLGLENNYKPPSKTLCEKLEHELHGSLGVMTLLFVVASVGYQMIGIPYAGLMADRTPSSQRGISSGLQGVMVIVGYLVGSFSGKLYAYVGVVEIYAILSAITITCVAIVVISQKEQKFVNQKVDWSFFAVCKGYIRPLRRHDFRWVFLTRFFMQMGLATVMYFLEFYFNDSFDLEKNGITAEQAVFYALLPMMIVAGISSALSGKLSDHMGGRRKVFVTCSAGIMAGAALGLIFARTLAVVMVLSGVFGLGYGVFMAVDFAMVLDVLPDESTRAKDLAVWHLSLVLPQLFATPLGGLIRDSVRASFCHNADECAKCRQPYSALFGITAGFFVLTALFVRCVRSVK